MIMIKKYLILLLLYCDNIYAFNFNTLQMKTNNNFVNNFSPIYNNKLKYYYKLTRPNCLVYEFACSYRQLFSNENIGVLLI